MALWTRLLSFLLISLLNIIAVSAHGEEGAQAEPDDSAVDTDVSAVIPRESSDMSADRHLRPIEIYMPGLVPETDDEYWCTTQPAPSMDSYITKFEAISDRSHAHHIMLYGCDVPSHDSTWKCHGQPCQRGESIMFAWAKHADPTNLPQDVGFHIGGNKVKHLVLQVHYKDALAGTGEMDRSGLRLYVTDVRPANIGGILLIASAGDKGPIPPHTDRFTYDVSCSYDGDQPLYPFAFRVHAHTLAAVITAYQYNDTYHLLGKGNPQWPQAFYPISEHFKIKHGDKLIGRCTYNSQDRDTQTYIGGRHTDEMCNFYMMYYTPGQKGKTYYGCGGNSFPQLVENLPPGSDVPPPRNRLLEDVALGNLQAIEQIPNWPKDDSIFGQVAGVDTDSNGNVHLFHRGSRTWDITSFDLHNKFTSSQPIAEDVVVTLNKDGNIIDQWGANMFYMPHGLHIDHKGNTWVTDVALHQVFRFKAREHTPDLTLGEKFVPGSDSAHFCKPTAVATLSNGQFFIADGYCNGRVMKYSTDAKLLKTWGERSSSIEGNGYAPAGTFSLPHAVAVLEQADLVCVADRLNRRVQCFDLEGKFLRQMVPSDTNAEMYSLDFSSGNGLLYAISGQDLGETEALQGYVFNPLNGSLLQTWKPELQPFTNPHDIAVSRDGQSLYVAEIKPNKLWKFSIGNSKAGGLDLDELAAKMSVGHPSSVDLDLDENSQDALEHEAEDDFGASLMIGALLIVPVLVIVIVTVCLRLKKRGKLPFLFGSRHHNRRLDLGTLLSRGRHNFSPLATDEKDPELDHLQSDSEIEEYTVTSNHAA